jgi:ribosomal protein L37AE/L43A
MRVADFVCPSCQVKEERNLAEGHQLCSNCGTEMKRKFSAPAIIIR